MHAYAVFNLFFFICISLEFCWLLHYIQGGKRVCRLLLSTVHTTYLFHVFFCCSLLQAVLFIICAVLYFIGCQEYLAFLVLSVALCWVNLLYFSRGTRHMGIYSVMIQRVTNFSLFIFAQVNTPRLKHLDCHTL